jgi:hypothetical protein
MQSPPASAHLIELPSVIRCQRLGSGALFKQFSELLIGHFFLFSCTHESGLAIEKADLPLPHARPAKQSVNARFLCNAHADASLIRHAPAPARIHRTNRDANTNPG